MSRGRGENLRPFSFNQLRPKPLRVNELAEFQESQELRDVELLSVKFGEITDTKTDTDFALSSASRTRLKRQEGRS
jgi:hypothetical protein